MAGSNHPLNFGVVGAERRREKDHIGSVGGTLWVTDRNY